MTHLFEWIQQPVYQGALFLFLTVVVAWIVQPQFADKVWVISGLMYCLFILTNAIVSFFAIEVWPYFFISLGISLLYILVIAVVANSLIKSLKLEGSGESAMIFLIIIFHPVALLLSIFFKWIFFKIF